ncbi:MAG: ABC transporter permease [Nocardioides sp.]
MRDEQRKDGYMSDKAEGDHSFQDVPSVSVAAPRRTGPGRAWLLVAQREVAVKATDRAFLIGTIVTVAIIVGVIVLQALLATRTQEFTVAVTTEATRLAEAVRLAAAQSDDIKLTVTEVDTDGKAKAAVTEEAADAWLHQSGNRWILTTKSEPNDDLADLVGEIVRSQALATNAAAAGTTVEDLERGATLTTTFLEGDAQRAQLTAIVGFAFAFLFYLASLMFGIAIANSVLEEKQSRVVEIIATAIPLRHLLAGKILGNVVMALGQLVVYAVVGLIGLAFTEYAPLVPAVSGPVAWFVAFFLAGFVALASLWAVAGSLASRSEDLQSTTVPLTLLTMTILFGGLFLEKSWQTVGSFVPPLSAVLMPIRLVEGDAAWWEAVVALALLLGLAGLTIRVGERIYRRSLLQSGGQVSLRQAWRAQE